MRWREYENMSTRIWEKIFTYFLAENTRENSLKAIKSRNVIKAVVVILISLLTIYRNFSYLIYYYHLLVLFGSGGLFYDYFNYASLKFSWAPSKLNLVSTWRIDRSLYIYIDQYVPGLTFRIYVSKFLVISRLCHWVTVVFVILLLLFSTNAKNFEFGVSIKH